MRSTLSLIALAALALPAAAQEPFFNGKDLAGWQGLPGIWSVKDGAIVGSSYPDGLKFNTFLCSQRPYRNFELRFKVKLSGGDQANSGVQIRSGVFDLTRLAVLGPQCDMGQIYWGSLYGEHFGGMMKQADPNIVKKALKPADFNDYHIVCVGQKVTIKLNGETTVDGDFKIPDVGLIAFQIHASPKPMEVTFKDIEFKELK